MALWRIRATVDDRPGYLSVLTASLALRAVNILAVQVHTTEAGAVDDFLVDAPDALTESDLLAAVERGRGRHPWVARAEAQGLADQPTRALALAGRLVHDPDLLGAALSSLLESAQVSWRPTAPGWRPGFDESTMRLADASGGAYEISRSAPAFTPAEYARAQALVEVAGAVLRQATERVRLLLSGGTEVLVRPACRDDLAAVVDMHRRCSPVSRRGRYLTGPDLPNGTRLSRLLEPVRGMSLLVETDGGQVVALASVLTEGRLGRAAVLVEDGWQHRGIGGALVRRLTAYAANSGLDALVGWAHADNPALAWLSAAPAVERDGQRAPAVERDGQRAPAVERDGQLVTVTVSVAAGNRAPGAVAVRLGRSPSR